MVTAASYNDAVVDLRWEQEGWALEMICGGLGDQLLAGPRFEDFHFPPGDSAGLCPSDGPCGLVVFSVTADGVPIEVGYDGDRPVAARIECVNDVAKLEAEGQGEWHTLGTFEIGEGRAVALDPSHRGYLAGRRWRLPLPAGIYEAQAFRTPNDDLGIRILLKSAR